VGRRAPGAGAKRRGTQRNVAHRERPALASRHPVHVTLRFATGLESLRRRRTHRIVRDALVAGGVRFGARIVHFAVMSNHIHLVCEAEDERALTRAIKGLGVRIARGLNALWVRSGRVIADRYHAHVLKTPLEVRRALQYVLHNARQHGIWFAGPDPCSSGAWFDGWDSSIEPAEACGTSPLPRARTWLLNVGWRRHGTIALALPARRS
jgi:REP element-mobilizing transposase RayT